MGVGDAPVLDWVGPVTFGTYHPRFARRYPRSHRVLNALSSMRRNTVIRRIR